MKHEQTEQPTELLRHIENTKFLLGIMSEPDTPWLRVSQFQSNCGTYRCWLGEFLHRKHLLGEYITKFDSFGWDNGADEFVYKTISHHFGGEARPLYERVFTSFDFSNEYRQHALLRHLDELKTQLSIWRESRQVGEVVA